MIGLLHDIGRFEETLLHSKIIRDADKLDNYRVKKDESIEAVFPARVKSIEDNEKLKKLGEPYQ